MSALRALRTPDSRTPGLQGSDSDNGTKDEDVRDSEESDKTGESAKDQGIKVNLVMPMVSNDNTSPIA